MGETISRKRFRFPIIVVALFAGVLLGLWVLSGDRFDLGSRRMYSIVAGFVSFALIIGWFWLASGAPWKQRLATFLLALAVIGGLVGSIRRVNFSGDMTPEFIWRWEDKLGVAADVQHAARSDATSGLPPIDLTASETDCLEYRGHIRDGIIPGPPLAENWEKAGPQLVWEQPCGGGYGAFVVAGNALFTIEQRSDDECIVCYDRETGVERWTYRYPEHFTNAVGGEGPRSTPTVWDGKVYALGASGHLNCLDATTGEVIWSDNIFDRAGVKNIDWGMSGSPLLVDGLVVVNCGNQKGSDKSRGVLAYNATSGELAWEAGTEQAGYSSPMLATLNGTRQILVFDAAGLASYDPAAGTELWQFPWVSDFDVNAVQPVVVDEQRVFISSNAGCALLQVEKTDDSWAVEELWRNKQLKCDFSCPILYEGHVYGLDKGILACVDVETGKRLWKGGRYGHGQMLLRDDLILVLAETGHLALVAATPEEFRELGKIEPFPEQKTWNNPTLVEDLAYIRNDLNMACYRLPTESVAPTDTTESVPQDSEEPVEESSDDSTDESE